jgi:hypothetical protein
MSLLEESLGVSPRHASEVSIKFLRGMCARMCMSFEKYGAVREAYPHKLDAVGCAFMRLLRYLGPERFQTCCKAALEAMPISESSPHRRDRGNTEYLMDASNFLMIEFMHPRHPDAHFKAEDSDASPGRMSIKGESVGQASNTLTRDNVRVGGFYKREGD